MQDRVRRIETSRDDQSRRYPTPCRCAISLGECAKLIGEAFGAQPARRVPRPTKIPSLASKPASGLAGVMPLEINRAPVLTLWAAVVAERLGHPADG
jgi:hypothetical protein